jgi:hypothetical protein
VDGLKNLNDFFLLVCNVVIFKEVSQLSLTDCNEGFFRPLAEPVQSTAVDQRGEHSQSGGESLADRTHGDDDVDVLLDSGKILSEDVHFVGLEAFFEAVSFAGIHDFIHVLFIVKSCDITGVEDGVEIFDHLFVDDLGVSEEE